MDPKKNPEGKNLNHNVKSVLFVFCSANSMMAPPAAHLADNTCELEKPKPNRRPVKLDLKVEVHAEVGCWQKIAEEGGIPAPSWFKSSPCFVIIIQSVTTESGRRAEKKNNSKSNKNVRLSFHRSVNEQLKSTSFHNLLYVALIARSLYVFPSPAAALVTFAVGDGFTYREGGGSGTLRRIVADY